MYICSLFASWLIVNIYCIFMRNRHFFLIAILSMFCSGLTLSAQTLIFVSSSASNDNGDGLTWGTAKRNISAGITAAGTSGVVCVKAGTYNINDELTIPAGVEVKGGYQQSSEGTDTSLRRLPGANLHWNDETWCTILQGDFHHRVATVLGILDGCVVSVGFTSSIGGGLLIDGGTARYCVLKECEAVDENEHSAEGGGAYIRNNGVLINSVVTQCRADNGVAVAGEDGSLINNTITRNSPVHCGYVVDVDGNYYNTVFIGTQCWMRENLRTTHFADSTPITLAYSATNDYPCYYKNNSLSEELSLYGYQYNWSAVMNGATSTDAAPSGVQGICPDGWHVPSRSEWNTLVGYVSSQRRYKCPNNENSYSKSLASKTGWNYTYNSCTPGQSSSENNATQFNAIPTGAFSGTGFNNVGSQANFWTATDNNYGSGIFRYIRYDQGGMDENSESYSTGYAVRCVKD